MICSIENVRYSSRGNLERAETSGSKTRRQICMEVAVY